VAIVQVSRITQRTGLEDDLPQPLAGAEFGWAIDQRKLYIGNGAIADGAPIVGNTEVLTEFSDILSFATAYTYQGAAAGYTVQTGATSGDPVSQSIQSRLDSYAVVTDFGATGNGSTDDTDSINRALYQLFCVQNNTQIRRSLFFPAGTYIVTDTILIPPYAKLYGEGADSSLIYFTVQTWAANTAYAAGVLVKSSGSYYRSIAAVPATGILLNNVSYWELTTLPELVVRTADSSQQTGVNIGVGGASPPQNIEVSSMSFQTTESGSHNVCLIEKAQKVSIDNVTFASNLTTLELQDAVEDISGITFSSTTALPCTEITIDKCKFTGMTYGINTDHQTAGVTVSNGWFDVLYQGVVLGSATPVDGGPSGFKVLHNVFDNIYGEGIVIQDCSLNGTGYNVFYDVGNHFNGTTSPASSIIDINAINNISVGDAFERTTTYSNTYPRIKLNNTNSIALGMNTSGITFYQSNVANLTFANQMALGTYQRSSGIQDNLTVSGSAQTLFTFDADNIAAVKIDYTTKTYSNNAVRTGTFTIVRSTSDSTGALASSDSGIENSHTDVTFSVSEDASTSVISWKYITSSSGTINYSVTKLA